VFFVWENKTFTTTTYSSANFAGLYFSNTLFLDEFFPSPESYHLQSWLNLEKIKQVSLFLRNNNGGWENDKRNSVHVVEKVQIIVKRQKKSLKETG
jgi:hypothetical protein